MGFNDAISNRIELALTEKRFCVLFQKKGKTNKLLEGRSDSIGDGVPEINTIFNRIAYKIEKFIILVDCPV